eukprot:13577_1
MNELKAILLIQQFTLGEAITIEEITTADMREYTMKNAIGPLREEDDESEAKQNDESEAKQDEKMTSYTTAQKIAKVSELYNAESDDVLSSKIQAQLDLKLQNIDCNEHKAYVNYGSVHIWRPVKAYPSISFIYIEGTNTV